MPGPSLAPAQPRHRPAKPPGERWAARVQPPTCWQACTSRSGSRREATLVRMMSLDARPGMLPGNVRETRRGQREGRGAGPARTAHGEGRSMNVTEKVAALEALLERVQKNARSRALPADLPPVPLEAATPIMPEVAA